MTDLEADALSFKLFGENLNPNPSSAWFCVISTEEELAEWSAADRTPFIDRMAVRTKVEHYTREQTEEDEGIRHAVPELDEVDLERVRRVPIENFSLQPMRRAGRLLLTLCPFHDDTTPSATVYPGGGGFYCFSCSSGGSAIDWAMGEFGFTFKQAVELLRGMA